MGKKDKDKNTLLNIQCYDRDFFKPNDLIGTNVLNISQIIEDCSYLKQHMVLDKDYLAKRQLKHLKEKFEFDKKDPTSAWIKLELKEGSNLNFRGKVRVRIDVLPAEIADQNPVGKARQQPNHSPFLPEPEGRIELSANPWKMYQQLIGPEVRGKVCFYLWLLICIVLCLTIGPYLIAQLIAKSLDLLTPSKAR